MKDARPEGYATLWWFGVGAGERKRWSSVDQSVGRSRITGSRRDFLILHGKMIYSWTMISWSVQFRPEASPSVEASQAHSWRLPPRSQLPLESKGVSISSSTNPKDAAGSGFAGIGELQARCFVNINIKITRPRLDKMEKKEFARLTPPHPEKKRTEHRAGKNQDLGAYCHGRQSSLPFVHSKIPSPGKLCICFAYKIPYQNLYVWIYVMLPVCMPMMSCGAT